MDADERRYENLECGCDGETWQNDIIQIFSRKEPIIEIMLSRLILWSVSVLSGMFQLMFEFMFEFMYRRHLLMKSLAFLSCER